MDKQWLSKAREGTHLLRPDELKKKKGKGQDTSNCYAAMTSNKMNAYNESHANSKHLCRNTEAWEE